MDNDKIIKESIEKYLKENKKNITENKLDEISEKQIQYEKLVNEEINNEYLTHANIICDICEMEPIKGNR